MQALEFRILGPLEVVAGDRPLTPRGRKQRALLALLLLHANEVVPSERLIDEIWGDEAPASGLAALTCASRSCGARSARPAGARTRPPGYLLHVDAETLDAARFEQLLARGAGAGATASRRAVELLSEALALWRGPALADLASEPFAQAEIARLEELRLACAEERIAAELALGRHRDVVGDLEALVATHPLRERLHSQLMLALYRSGPAGRRARRVPRRRARRSSTSSGSSPARSCARSSSRSSARTPSSPRPRRPRPSRPRPPRPRLLPTSARS